MTDKVLFGAEADKIQDTLFRAARQRQVVGGSRLLVEFGGHVKALAQKEYGVRPEDVLVTDGGNFRILFPKDAKVDEFARRLTDAYRLLLDASITIADEQRDSADFKAANEAVGKSIQRRKRAERGAADSSHAPPIAFCQSSGVGLAQVYDYPARAETSKQYLSRFAQAMGLAGEGAREDEGIDESDSFLGRVRASLPNPSAFKGWRWALKADEIADYDGERKNVAYLIADGNNMGKLFGACRTSEQLKELSDTLNEVMYRAAASIIPLLAARLPRKKILPVLPLILAGDDAFLLLPARHALDAAQQFCLEFETAFATSTVVKSLVQDDCPPPTLAATVVICKGTYPYHLAHQRGEETLERVKRLIKTIGAQPDGKWHSALGFDLIVGSELVTGGQRITGTIRPSLAVYWASHRRAIDAGGHVTTTEQTLSAAAQRASHSIERLLEQRLRLAVLPNKRLTEVRELFAAERLPDHTDALETQWNPRLRKLRDRLRATDRSGEGIQLARLDKAMAELGDPSDTAGPGHWWHVQRRTGNYFGHGLPDLIEVWNYAQSLDQELKAYTGEAR
jgi:hypothetical protein